MEFSALQGDIMTFAMDATVNVANISLLGGDGMDGAIYRAADPEPLEECRRSHGCGTGHVKVTSGYRLPINYVIHTLDPAQYDGGVGKEGLFASCYQNCLRSAEENGCHTVAFPSISTGICRFPLECAAYIAVREILAFSQVARTAQSIIMVCFGKGTRAAYGMTFRHTQ